MKRPCRPRLLAAAVVAGCACQPAAVPGPSGDASVFSVLPSSPASAPTVSAAPPPAPWALVYRRGCYGSITAPVLAPDGAAVDSCGARFDTARGRFLGAAPSGVLALLPDDRALIDESGAGGLTVIEQGSRKGAHDPGGHPVAIAVSPDGARVVSLETRGHDRLLLVRALPSLERVRTTSLGPGPAEGSVGFLPDGREIVFAAYPCTEHACSVDGEPSCRTHRCPASALFVVDRGALVSLGSSLLSELSAAAISPGGDVAAVIRRDGSSALVSLPAGQEIASLPPQSRGARVALAASSGGDRVALAAEGRLAVLARSGSAFVERFADARRFVRTMVFTVDGRTLFTGEDLFVYREGAAPREVRVPRYDVALPRGFERLAQKGSAFVWPTPDEDHASPLGTFAFFAEPRLGVQVLVVALDPEEFDPTGDVLAWGTRVAGRLFPNVPLSTAQDRAQVELETWGDERAGRSVQLHLRARSDAAPDAYHRVTERDGALVHVALTIPGKPGRRQIASWLRAFFDVPLGTAPKGSNGQAQD